MKWLKRKAEIENLDTMIEFIIEHLKKNVKVTQHVDMEVRLLCEEVLMNIINHAYCDKCELKDMYAGYEYDNDRECVVLKIIDHGVPFNPISEEEPKITGTILERQIGGLGILLIKKISDVIEYERKDDMNILTIRKYYQPININMECEKKK